MNAPRMFLRKALVGWLAYAMTFGPSTPVMAQVADNYLTSKDYSDVPLPAKKRPNPNLIFAIDDSGSMDNELSLNANDGAGWYYTAGLTSGSGTVDGKTTPSFWGLNQLDKQQAGVPNFNNGGNANGTWKKYVALFPNGYYNGNLSHHRRPADLSRRGPGPLRDLAVTAVRPDAQPGLQQAVLQPDGDLPAVEAVQRRHDELPVGHRDRHRARPGSARRVTPIPRPRAITRSTAPARST